MKLVVSSILTVTILTSCSNSNLKNNKKSNNNDSLIQKKITYDGVDDLYENTPPHSPFARPKNGKVGLDVDGVLHTEVNYSLTDQYHPSKFVFNTKGRNIRLKKEIKFLQDHGNYFNIVTHNRSFCLPGNALSQKTFLKSNGLDPILSSNIFCVTGNKSTPINTNNITTFYDDSPAVLEEIAKTNYAAGNGRKAKLFMVLPKHQKVAHYFSNYSNPTEPIDACGLLIVDDSTPKRFLLQLRSAIMTWAPNEWNFPGGACAYKENQGKNCANGECEDPVTGAMREFNEEAGKEFSIENVLDKSKRLMVLRSNKYMLFAVKFDKNDISKYNFIPDNAHAFEVSKKVFNIAGSPGYRWFDLAECKEGATIDGHIINKTGKTCDTFRNVLEQF